MRCVVATGLRRPVAAGVGDMGGARTGLVAGGVVGAVMQDRVARYVELIERPDTLEVISQRVADEGSLALICKSLDVPHGRVLAWLMADAARYAVYLRALEVYAHEKVSETIAIADEQKEAVRKDGGTYDPDVARDALRINTRFRAAKHHAPGLYAEKVEVKHSGVITMSHALQGIAARRLAAKRGVIDVTPVREDTVL